MASPSTSRIFIRNLPPSLTDNDFRLHFSRTVNDITDAKFLRHRRIGYVGYKTPAEALSAVKYFNKSFIRMSRINVELANPVADNTVIEAGAKSKKNEEDSAESVSKKRKREAETEVKNKGDDTKLKEFLHVMQAQKAKTWQNDAMDGVEPSESIPQADPDSDEEMQVIGIKVSEEEEEPEPNTTAKKDQDLTDDAWIKSRKTVLLDDNGETVTEQADSMEVTETKPETLIKSKDLAPEPEPENLGPVDKIRLLKRLYLRNLPFNATEEDIAQKFGEFGDLTEASLSYFFSSE
jgi:multiple RNA-binding domain-containing protein 1